ncbi:MAG: D-glycero-beta-D-manno-heptose-7-phosphate kinase [Rhodospirillales bacterium]|nr:D-glycero-beta-D-manno-heptose-7-phosphate kinase [Rhodospirillales bacterium]MCB9997227.1 D-glycero-beta-D-manno-heptose-7-phosphate kinase [Rhodospirillales bacterium]
MKQRAILVVGDIMLDRFVYGDAGRISPEGPVPVLAVKRESQMLGGAGNVLANLHGLGVKPHILSVIGEDDAGRQVRELAASCGADPQGLLVSGAVPTIVKTRYIAAGQQLLRADREKAGAVPDSVHTALLAQAKIIMPHVQALILSDYGKGVLTEDVIAALIGLAKDHNVPVLVDPKKTDYSVYRGASVVTPNRKELAESCTGAATETDEDITAAMRHVLTESGIGAVIATRSQQGMSVLEGADAAPVHLRTTALEVFDVSGAGDTVIATIAAGLAAGANLTEAAMLANYAGGIVVAKVGTAAIRNDELSGALRGHDTVSRTREAPLLDWGDAAQQVRRWQAQGLKVGFTNGCFDILHFGHVTYINRARDLCDRLVLALNHDRSVQILKGPERPLHDERARASVIGALGAVDMVVLFGASEAGRDNTPCALLEQLQPDIYFKGGDYTIDQLPEAKIVGSYGGRVELMNLYEGHSTTSTIEKMKTSG